MNSNNGLVKLSEECAEVYGSCCQCTWAEYGLSCAKPNRHVGPHEDDGIEWDYPCPKKSVTMPLLHAVNEACKRHE